MWILSAIIYGPLYHVCCFIWENYHWPVPVTDDYKILKTAIYEAYCVPGGPMLYKGIKHMVWSNPWNKQAIFFTLHLANFSLSYSALSLVIICSRKPSLSYHVQVSCLFPTSLLPQHLVPLLYYSTHQHGTMWDLPISHTWLQTS